MFGFPETIVPNNLPVRLTENYSSLVTAAGGALNTNEFKAHVGFLETLFFKNILSKFKEIWLGAGSNSAAGMVKSIYPSGVQSSLTNVGFTAGNYSRTGGFQGGTGYFRTGFIPSAQIASSDNFALSCYVKNTGSLGGTSTHYMGSNDALRISTINSTTSLYASLGNNFYSKSSANASDSFICASNIKSGTGYLKKNGSIINSAATVAPTTLPSTDIWLYNISGVATNQRCSGKIYSYTISTALTDAESQVLYNALLNFYTNISR